MKNFGEYLIVIFFGALVGMSLSHILNRDKTDNLKKEIITLQKELAKEQQSNEFTTFEYSEILEDMAINDGWEYTIIVSKAELEGKLYSDKYIIIYGDYDPEVSPYKVEAYD